MYRGFIKCWRCAEDSRAWSRGALHRGVMLTILLKVAWKDCYYRGDELKAGQFAFSGAYLAEECQLSRTTLLSILDDLEQDGFLTRRSVGNRYTLIMVTNWARYQSSDASGCKAGCSSAEQPSEQPALQPPDTIKEYKKARKELSSASDDAAVSEGAFPDAMGEGEAVPLPGTSGGGREAVPEPEGKASAVQAVAPVPRRPSRSGIDGGQAFYVSAKGRRLSGQALADFETFWDAYRYRCGKAEAADMWLAATRKAPELVPVIIRAASAAAAEHEELAARVKGRIRMYAENWLQGRRWEDFEACGALSLPPAAGEDRARTDAGRCATVRHGGQGAREGTPAAPPIPEGRPLPPPGTPERARLEAMPPTRRTSRMTAEEDSRWRDGLKGLFQIRRSRGLPVPQFLRDMAESMEGAALVGCTA